MSQLSAFLSQIAQKHNHQGVSQLLIAPIQRLPRYLLLLDRLRETTQQTSPDYDHICNALERMKVVADQVDQCQRQSENGASLLRLQSLGTSRVPCLWLSFSF